MSVRAPRPCAALALMLTLGSMLLPASAAAQAAPAAPAAQSTQSADAEVRRMIDSLKPPPAPPRPPATAPRTRNLVIEPNAAREPAAPPPAPAAVPAASAPVAPAAAAPAASAATPATALAPATASAPAEPAPSGLSLAIGFEPNSAQLHPESGATLGALVAAMLSSELLNHRFVIEGHTDASGSPAQNLRLSRERAEQVRLFLVTLGVAGERLRAVGKGASELANAHDPRAPENRRVRVVALP